MKMQIKWIEVPIIDDLFDAGHDNYQTNMRTYIVTDELRIRIVEEENYAPDIFIDRKINDEWIADTKIVNPTNVIVHYEPVEKDEKKS